jgi:predicted nuclease of predicted toxin-antitoxin system
MKFFLDENFPKTATILLKKHGHTVHDIRSTENEGSSDDVIFKMAQTEEAIFLTTDKDFYHTIPYRFRKHHGVVIIRLRQPNRNNILKKLEYFLDHFDPGDMKFKVVLLKDNSISVFRKKI